MRRLSPSAQADLALIQDHTARIWGLSQSEKYVDMIDDELKFLESNPTFGQSFADQPELRVHFVKWRNAKFGHNIIFRRRGDDLEIVRILHSAMDVASHLRVEG